MATKPLPDVETLRKLLDYDPETGFLTWKPRPVEMFPNEPKFKRWNTRYANKRAGNAKGYQKGYIAMCILSKNYPAHRVAWAMHYGEWPKDQIDHINRQPADNRISNLRIVSNFENCRNKGFSKKNTSGHIGVHLRRNTGKWYAYISMRGRVSLGSFNTFEEAVAARKAGELKYGYHPNHGS